MVPELAGVISIVLLIFSGAVPPVSVPIRLSGPSPFASPNCIGNPGGGTNYLNDEVEPYVAASPTQHGELLAAVWQQDRWDNDGARGIMAAVSTGGRNGSSVPLPFTRCAHAGLNYDRASDPWVSIGPDGRIYVSALILTAGARESAGLAVSWSSDRGATWSTPVVVSPDSSDKDAITADPTHAGVAYLTWDGAAGTASGQLFAMTDDGGAVWSNPTAIQPFTPHVGLTGGQIVIDPRSGTLDAFYVEYRAKRVSGQPVTVETCIVAVSNNRGKTWTRHLVAEERPVGAPTEVVGPIRSSDGMPNAAIDPRTGRLYVVWEDARFAAGKRADAVISVSEDGGRTWTRPERVDPESRLREFNPSVAVNAAGRVGVTYYAVPNHRSPHANLPTRYEFQVSCNHGMSFSRPIRIGSRFRHQDVPFPNLHFLGDYEGLTSEGKRFLAVYSAGTDGEAGNPTDIFAARITPPSCTRATSHSIR